MATTTIPTTFKFRYVRNGQPAGLFAKNGSVTEEALVLGESRIPWAAITDTTTRDDRLLLVVEPGATLDKDGQKFLMEGSALALAPQKIAALELERQIDRRASRAEVEATRKKLEAEGRLAEFRTAQCPACDATVNLTGVEESRHVYCRFCDTIFAGRTKQVTTDAEHRTCSECNLYGRVRGYTEFYFYFLLVVYGFSFKRRHLCDGCAGRLFWKVLILNSIFVLGVPSAVWLKAKSMTGRDPKLKALAHANAKARQGKVKEADALYAEVLRALPDHPGVLLNQAQLHLKAGDGEAGVRALKRSLTSCSNYGPSLALAQALQELPGQSGAKVLTG